MKTRVLQPRTEVKERLTTEIVKSPPKRCNLTQARRQRIEFFVRKSVDDVSIGRIRSSTWLQFLEKFINTPGVDSTVLLNWLDKIPCLKSYQLYTNEFYRKFRPANSGSKNGEDVSFPQHWNTELAKVFQDTTTVPTPMQDDSKGNNQVKEEHERTAAAGNATENPGNPATAESSEMNCDPMWSTSSSSPETKPMLKRSHSETKPTLPKFSSDFKPTILKRRFVDIKPALPKGSSETKPTLTRYVLSPNISDDSGDQLSSNSSRSFEELFPDLVFPKVETVNNSYDEADNEILPPPPVPVKSNSIANGVLKLETTNCDSESTVEMGQVTLEKMKESKTVSDVDEDVLSITAEELLKSTGNSEDDQYYIDSFDELLLPETDAPVEKNKGPAVRLNGEEMQNSVLSELEDPAEQGDFTIEIDADASKSVQSNLQDHIPGRDTQWTTQKRLYFHKIRALCGPNDTEAFLSICELENRVKDMSQFLQNVSFYINYSTDSLEKIFSSMAATYEAVQK